MRGLFLQTLSLLTAGRFGTSHLKCKASPGSQDWPNSSEWTVLNHTISGRLLQPSPPGAICHPDQPTYSSAACPALQSAWLLSDYHTEHPTSVLFNNWSNDTCLPDPDAPCSGDGYPLYVINATSVEDVKNGVDFARKHHVRLIVKATGHDYLGRSTAPNSLSIWTHHLKGLTFHSSFTPKGCRNAINGPAITAGSGSQFGEINEQASLRNLTVVSGGSVSVSLGGYLTAAGHGALSPAWGLAADNVLEMEMVTPDGNIITANECQNEDLFWAMRGGGGSTFGVLTSATMRAYPSPRIATVGFILGTMKGNPNYWPVISFILAAFDSLSDAGVSGYAYLLPSYSGPADLFPYPASAFAGIFILPLLSPTNSSATLAAAVHSIFASATKVHPLQFTYFVTPAEYNNFYTWHKDHNGPKEAGENVIVGSRLLGAEHFSDPKAVGEAFRAFIPEGGSAALHLVSGKGVWDAKPRGGGNAVNPAWRRTLVHATTYITFPPLDPAAKANAEHDMTYRHVAAMRKLAPDTGAYQNEADPNEPDFQSSFWGDNYNRLLAIKKDVDPDDVLWCQPCVGNEGWEEIGSHLCRI